MATTSNPELTNTRPPEVTTAENLQTRDLQMTQELTGLGIHRYDAITARAHGDGYVVPDDENLPRMDPITCWLIVSGSRRLSASSIWNELCSYLFR